MFAHHTFTYTHIIHIYTSIHISMYIQMSLHSFIQLRIVYVYTYINFHIYVYTYIYPQIQYSESATVGCQQRTYVRIYIYIYVHIYVHTHHSESASLGDNNVDASPVVRCLLRKSPTFVGLFCKRNVRFQGAYMSVLPYMIS